MHTKKKNILLDDVEDEVGFDPFSPLFPTWPNVEIGKSSNRFHILLNSNILSRKSLCIFEVVLS